MKTITVGKTVLPDVPFAWYREQQMYCPIEFIVKTSASTLQHFAQQNNISIPKNGDTYIIIQRNVLDANLYISFHSYLYARTQENTVIPLSYRHNFQVQAKTHTIKNIKCINGSHALKQNTIVTGSVHIHDHAFSPPGHFHFRAINAPYSVLLVHGKHQNINVTSLFILLNEFTDQQNNLNPYDVMKEVLELSAETQLDQSEHLVPA